MCGCRCCLVSFIGLVDPTASAQLVVIPGVSVSTTTVNGWTVVIGRAAGQLIWLTRLAPAGEPVSLDSGDTTSFVRVGPRVFAVDNNTGATRLLGARAPIPTLPEPPTATFIPGESEPPVVNEQTVPAGVPVEPPTPVRRPPSTRPRA